MSQTVQRREWHPIRTDDANGTHGGTNGTNSGTNGANGGTNGTNDGTDAAHTAHTSGTHGTYKSQYRDSLVKLNFSRSGNHLKPFDPQPTSYHCASVSLVSSVRDTTSTFGLYCGMDPFRSSTTRLRTTRVSRPPHACLPRRPTRLLPSPRPSFLTQPPKLHRTPFRTTG